jgi:hypothetical protein
MWLGRECEDSPKRNPSTRTFRDLRRTAARQRRHRDSCNVTENSSMKLAGSDRIDVCVQRRAHAYDCLACEVARGTKLRGFPYAQSKHENFFLASRGLIFRGIHVVKRVFQRIYRGAFIG